MCSHIQLPPNARAIGRSVGHHRRAREGREYRPSPGSANGTQPVVSSSVVVPVSRLALHRSSSVTRTWRIVRFFFLLVFFPCGTLQLSQFTAALQIIHAFGADHSRTALFRLPSFLPSSLVSHYSIRLSRRRSLPKMTNSRRRRRRRRRRSDGAMAEKRMPVQ